MRKRLKLLFRTGLLLVPTYLLAQSEMVIVADSRKVTGLKAWWANFYNEGHLQFALFTIILVPLVGAILGTLADQVMKRTGIDLKSRSLREG